MKAVNLLSAYADKLELNIKELHTQLEESRHECNRLKTENEEMRSGRYERGPVWDALQESRRERETLRNGYAPGLALQHEHQDLRTQLQSSLAREATMRVALERIIRVDFCDSVRCDHSAELVDDVARAALSPNAANPILDAMRAARDCIKFYAGKDDDAFWELNRFIAINKFGMVDELVSGPYVALEALKLIDVALEG